LSSTDFGITRSTNFLPAVSTLTNSQTLIDNNSFNKFLDLQMNQTSGTTTLSNNISEKLVLNSNSNLNKSSNFSNRSESALFSSSNDLLTSSKRLSIATIADGEDKILPTDQSLQQQPFINPNNSYDFFTKTLSENQNEDLTLLNSTSALSNRVFTNTATSPLTSTSSQRNRFTNSFYEGTMFKEELENKNNKISSNVNQTSSSAISANSGTADKIPTPLVELY